MRAISLVGAVMLAANAAFAQPVSLFGEGKQLLQDGKPAEACVKFEAALREQPEAPGILLNLGLCNAQQNKIATALKWFRKAQTRAVEGGMADTENAAKLQTVALAAKVPTIAIAIAEPPPADARVTVDGATIDSTSFARLEIDAGPHVIELRGSGLEPDRVVVKVEDDADTSTVVTLHVVAAVAPIHAAPVIAIDRGRPWRKWAYLLGGTGAGLLVVETAVGLAARKIFDDAHDVATRRRWKNIVRYGGTATFAVGVAALGTAVALYLAAPGTEREHAAVVPFAGADQLGLALTGTF